MRNLVIVQERWDHRDIEGGRHEQEDGVVALAADYDSGHTYFATRKGNIYGKAANRVDMLNLSLTTFSEDGNPPFLEPGAEVVALEWVPEHEALAVASSYGDLLLVHRSPLEVETVGVLGGGVAGMAWGPDGEVVAIATGVGKLLLMTKDWDVLAEVDLDPPSQSDGQLSNGHPGMEHVSISWRGDGKYFTTNARGAITVWEREGCVLHARAEVVPGLQSHVAWQPRGALIAAVQSGQGAKCPQLVLFERNGLRKGGFELETVPGSVEVCGMQWNASSELLGIALKWGDVTVVQVWYMSNYHWYLKREWRRSSATVGTLNFAWDPETPLRLQLWTTNGAHSHLDLGWQSAVAADSCTALVIDGPRVRVTPLLETVIPPPMCAAAVHFGAPVQAACLGADESGFGEVLAAILSDGRIGLAHCVKKGRWEDAESEVEGKYGEPIIKAEIVEGVTVSDRLVAWTRGSPLTLVAVQDKDAPAGSLDCGQTLSSFHFASQTQPANENGSSSTSKHFTLQSTGSHSMKGRVLSFVPAPSVERDLVLLEGGLLQWWGMSRPAEDFLTLKEGNFARVEAARVGSSCHVIALVSGKLYLSQQCVAPGVTSFVLRGGQDSGPNEGGAAGSAYVIWTTQKDELCIAELREKGLGKQRAMPLNERGAVIVAALGEEAGVLIQTPRGNLETLYPRELVLATAARRLRTRDYAQALEVCRRHRLDLNLVVDYGGWERFVEDAPTFVKAVGSPAKVAELVTALHGGDVTREAYKGLLPPWNEDTGEESQPRIAPPGASRASQTRGPEKGKVTAVCTAIREALQGGEGGGRSGAVGLCILATHARSQPPQLEEALRMLKELRRAELQKDPNAALASLALAGEAEDDEEGVPLIADSVPLTADRAMQHLIWLCGAADALYDVALGMYDLELAAMVAAQAQMDPKEFLPYLQSLASLSPTLRNYTIDRKLGRWESALRNLAQAGDEHFPTCLSILSQHPDLYPTASNTIFLDNPPARSAILAAWGDHLLKGEDFEQAAMTFLAGGHLKQALGAYRTGGLWRAMFRVAGRLGQRRERIEELAREVTEELQAMGRPGDAAHVCIEYLNNVDRGVGLLVEAGAWSEAVRVAYAHEKGQLVDDVIHPAAVAAGKAHLVELQEGQEKVGKYLARFQAVRQRRVQLAARVGATGGGAVDDDGASVATTATSTAMSGYSAYTHGTGGNESSVGTSSTKKRLSKRTKKKQQQGGGKIRAGSPEEEAALVTHLVGLSASEPLKVELRQLAEVLVLLGEEALARQLQGKSVAFQRSQEQAVSEAQAARLEDKASADEEAEQRRVASRQEEPSESGTSSLVRSFVGDHNVGKRSGRLDFRTKPSIADNILGSADKVVGEIITIRETWEVLEG